MGRRRQLARGADRDVGEGYTVHSEFDSFLILIKDNDGDTSLPLLTIKRRVTAIVEGQTATFDLKRTGDTSSALTVNVIVRETGDRLADNQPTQAIFAANSATATLEVPTVDDTTNEPYGWIIARIAPVSGYRLAGSWWDDIGSEAAVMIWGDDD